MRLSDIVCLHLTGVLSLSQEGPSTCRLGAYSGYTCISSEATSWADMDRIRFSLCVEEGCWSVKLMSTFAETATGHRRHKIAA